MERISRASSALGAVDGKWASWVHQTPEMKGKEGRRDLGGADTKSGSYSS